MLLRPMEIKDVNAVHEIEKQCFASAWSEQVFIDEISYNAMATYIVAELDGVVTGYIGYWQVLDEGHITVVCVNPSFRGQGIAKALISEMMKVAKKQYINKMTLEVRESNLPAINLYKRSGFYEVGVRKKYYINNNEDAIIMFADL